MTHDDELEQDYDPIREEDRSRPKGPVPSREVVEAVWALVGTDPRQLGEPWLLYSRLRARGLGVTFDQVRLALLV